MKDILLFSYDAAPVSVAVEISAEGVTVNRWALMAEFYIHSTSREASGNYFTKIPQEGKNHILTDGMAEHFEQFCGPSSRLLKYGFSLLVESLRSNFLKPPEMLGGCKIPPSAPSSSPSSGICWG